MATLFERLERPPPTEEVSKHEKSHLIERLLNWLVNNWTKDTITARQLRHYGPYPLRYEPKVVLDLAQGLVERGWISPIKPKRHDAREWKIGPKSNYPVKEQNGA